MWPENDIGAIALRLAQHARSDLEHLAHQRLGQHVRRGALGMGAPAMQHQDRAIVSAPRNIILTA